MHWEALIFSSSIISYNNTGTSYRLHIAVILIITLKSLSSNNPLKHPPKTGQVKLDGVVVGLSLSHDSLELLATTGSGTVSRMNIDALQSIVISESHTQGITDVKFSIGSNERFATSSTFLSSEYVIK